MAKLKGRIIRPDVEIKCNNLITVIYAICVLILHKCIFKIVNVELTPLHEDLKFVCIPKYHFKIVKSGW